MKNFLPAHPPTSLQDWHTALCHASDCVTSSFPKPPRRPLVDEGALHLRNLRNNAHGSLRRELSKLLYSHLKRTR
eukprot:6486309-Amphidinium_carterae.1